MSVSAVSSNANAVAAVAPQAKSAAMGVIARARDGDYKAPTATSSHVKDADGDYKPRAAASSAAKQSSAAVQGGLVGLKVGG